MKKRAISVLLLLFLLVPAVYAETIITQPNLLYNRGDAFNVSVQIVRSSNTNDFISLTLNCDSGIVELYKSPLYIKAGDKKTVNIETTLDRFVLKDLLGSCTIKSAYANELATSRIFTITKDIDITLDTPIYNVNPGSSINISGRASKKNSLPLTGFIELRLDNANSTNILSVNNGKFSGVMQIPEDSHSGIHEIALNAYEKDLEELILNEGTTKAEIKVAQVAKKIDIALSSQEIIPGNEIIYSVIVYDQAGEQMDLKVPVSFENPLKDITEKILSTNATQTYLLNQNSSPGAWNIKSNLGDLSTVKTFTVSTLENATFQLLNTTLTITNTGNIPYAKPVEIKIGDLSEVKSLSLAVGESIKFRLGAPDGEYSIAINDGENTKELGRTFLTGNAVTVQDELNNLKLSYTWIWLVIIIGLGIMIVKYYGNSSRKPRFSSKPVYYAETPSKPISHGEKQKSSIIVLKIKNEKDIKNKDSPAKEAIRKAINEVRSRSIQASRVGDSIVFVLAPLMTNNPENSAQAVECASKLNNILEEHNNRHPQKVQYGIGVHEGELIVEYISEKFNFNSLGNTLSFAKKLAENAENEVLISNPIHTTNRGKIKVEKKNNFWKLESINQTGKHKEFINKFMQRQERDR